MTEIGNDAFIVCNKLRSPMRFPNCTKLGGPFSSCSSIPEFYFPLVTEIGNNAFVNCSSCTNFGLAWADLTRIGNDAFTGCSKLTGDYDFGAIASFPQNFMNSDRVTSLNLTNATS